MWRKKRFILVGILAAIVLVGSIAGVALARTGTAGTTAQSGIVGAASDNTGFWTKFAANLSSVGVTVDQQTLQNAYTKTQQQVQDEALDSYLNKQIAAGKITADDAAKYKAWVKSKPSLPGGFPGSVMRGFPGGKGWCGR